ncbi:MAG: hypothetical protein AAF933_12340 [Pseudomonadota bacterium]
MRWLIALALLALFCLASGLGLLLRGTSLSLAMPLLEREAEKALGRDVTFREAPWLQLGSTSVLAVSGLEIANAEWGTEDSLLELAEAEVQLEFSSLFNPPLSIVSLRIEGLRVHLERNTQGLSNVPKLASAQPEIEPAQEPSDNEDLDPPVLLRDLQLQRVEVHSFDASTDTRRSFTIDQLTQTSETSEELVLSGAGSLQTRPWTLAGTHSGIASIAQGRQLWGKLNGQLDGLELVADYRLVHIAELEDLSLQARVAGPVPPRVAELSPLLNADQPIELNISVLDVDPGVSLDAVLDLGETEVHVSGSADDPGGGDGLDLNISLDAPSFPRLAEALGLGETEESELDLNAVVRREGRRFVIDDLLATVGDHRVEGRLFLPRVPGTTNARIDLRASGPEFAFFQRLFRRPFEVAAPYSLHVEVSEGDNGNEKINTTVNLGNTRVAVEGELGDFPSYRNSRMNVDIRGDDLAQVGRSLELELPTGPFSLGGELLVSNTGRVTFERFRGRAAETELQLSGGVNGYPELDEMDLFVTLRAPSIRPTARALGLGSELGDVAAEFEAQLAGSMNAVRVTDLTAVVGDSRIESTAGSITMERGALGADLVLRAEVEGLKAALGSYAPQAYRGRPFSFTAAADISSQGYGLEVSDLRGQAISGSAEFFVGPELLHDDQLRVAATLNIERPEEFLPPILGFTPPTTPILVSAQSRGRRGTVNASVSSANATLLSARLQREQGVSVLELEGEGADLYALGSVEAMPPGPLPYELQSSLRIASDVVDVELPLLNLGGSQLQGSVRLGRGDLPFIFARLDVPEARLDDWLPSPARDTPETADPVATSEDGRLIPDLPIPVELIERYELDVDVTTGTLGVRDPGFPLLSLVDSAEFQLRSDTRDLRLHIEEMRGSRGQITLDLTARRNDSGALFTIDADIDQLPAGLLTTSQDAQGLPRFDIDAQLSAAGRTTRELAASLNGELLATGGSGTLPRLGIGLATDSFVQQIADVLLPGIRGQEKSAPRAQCSVLALWAKDGIVNLDPGFVIRTQRIDLSARGNVNLGDERLAVRFDNQARKGLGISAASIVNPYVQITGTLAQPKIGLDVTSSALAGSAAVATGGLTVIAKPLFGRFLDRRSPCTVALKRWEDGKDKRPSVGG